MEPRNTPPKSATGLHMLKHATVVQENFVYKNFHVLIFHVENFFGFRLFVQKIFNMKF